MGAMRRKGDLVLHNRQINIGEVITIVGGRWPWHSYHKSRLSRIVKSPEQFFKIYFWVLQTTADRVFVGGVPPQMSNEAIATHFSKYGPVQDIEGPPNKNYLFVVFTDPSGDSSIPSHFWLISDRLVA